MPRASTEKMGVCREAVALLAGQRTCDLKVVGSSAGWAPMRNGLGQATCVIAYETRGFGKGVV